MGGRCFNDANRFLCCLLCRTLGANHKLDLVKKYRCSHFVEKYGFGDIGNIFNPGSHDPLTRKTRTIFTPREYSSERVPGTCQETCCATTDLLPRVNTHALDTANFDAQVARLVSHGVFSGSITIRYTRGALQGIHLAHQGQNQESPKHICKLKRELKILGREACAGLSITRRIEPYASGLVDKIQGRNILTSGP